MAAPSRSIGIVVFRFILVVLLASVLQIGTALLIASAIAWLWDGVWNAPQVLGIGSTCALIFWLFVAVFHLRRETQLTQFAQREPFVAKLKTVLQEMGYVLSSQRDQTLMFRPRFHSYLFGGGIQVDVGVQEAKLTGPKVSLEIFRRCFRLLKHVQRVQVYLQDQRKFTDNVIKRVELRARPRPDQLEAVRKNIIEPLQKDAKVVCELNLLVQSEKGIRESTLEFQVREWFEEHNIPVEIHKDLVQFVEVVHPELETEAASH
jgi:hypothetical protein